MINRTILSYKYIYVNMGEFIKPDFSNINVDKSLPTISISTLLNTLVEPFNQEAVAQRTFNKHYNDIDSEYYQMSVDQIIEKWNAKGAESCRYGSMLDDYIGFNLNKKNTELNVFKVDNDYDNDKRLHGLCDSFDNFYSILQKSGDTIFVDRERTVYYDIEIEHPITGEMVKYNIKGRFDALFYNKRTNKWILIDWKSSGSIDKVPNNWTAKLKGPLQNYPALNYYTYTTQLYFYKKTLIEKGYLPEGTQPDDVVIMIVNLPGKIIPDCGRNFATHQAAYPYDAELLKQFFIFGIKESQSKNEEIINNEENLEEIF